MRGSATVVSIFYGLLYLYLLPLSVIALIAFGMGLLSLTPVFCAVVTLCINTGHRYQTNLPANHRGLFRWGIILALVTLTVLEFPSLWTRVVGDLTAGLL